MTNTRKYFSGALILVVSLILFSQEAFSAKHPFGDELLWLCNTTSADINGDERFARCQSYLKSTRKILATSPVHGIRACVPDTVTDLRLLFTALHWLGDNPNSQVMEADEIIARAWAKSWPCQEK